MAKYHLRYFFDAGSGICLWAANDAASDKWGYPIDVRHLPLPENTWRRAYYIIAWYDTCIDWDYPPGPSPWDKEEQTRFHRAAQDLLILLRTQLGEDFEIIDES